MHELSIARGILDIVHENVCAHDLAKVRGVTVKVGAFSGVVPDSLEFGYQSYVSGTPLAKSSLHFDRVPFRIRCNRCLETTENENGFALCGKCWSGDTTVLSGNELQVVQIELDDDSEGSP